MSQALDVMKQKSSPAVFSITPDEPAMVAARALAELNVGALLVMEQGRALGIVSERDLVRALAHHGRVDGLTVRSLMTAPVRVVRPDTPVAECMAIMTDTRVRHLPVVDADGSLLGILSIGDLVKDTIRDQAFVIEQLEHYITGP